MERHTLDNLATQIVFTMAGTTHQANVESSGADNIDLDQLVYKFDAAKPWQYFKQGHPTASSVEKGSRTLKAKNKLKRVYVPKKKRWNGRKNGAFKDLDQLEFTCCDSDCLLKEGLYHIKGIARQQRNMLYQKPYSEQNYLLSKLIELKLTFRGVRKITYHIPSLGKVCKTAFRKVYGISKSKVEILLKKIDLEGLSIEPDRRGQKTPRKLLPEARNAIINFILSYEATESHYRRARSGCKRYFDSNISMRTMWSEFVHEHPHFKTTSLRKINNGPVVSFSAFRNLFNNELKDVLSFRKSRVDTCQECDKYMSRLDYLRSLSNPSSNQRDEIHDLTACRSSHLRESEIRFASLRYDVTILTAKVL